VISKFSIRRTSIDEVRQLRNSILRPGFPPETCVYTSDEAKITFHAGAFIADELVGIASVFKEPPPFQKNSKAWRLRGMAVKENARRLGCGTALIDACLNHIDKMEGTLLWCNARVDSLPFYEKNGFQVIGDRFNIPESGLHYVMWRSASKP
jgi:ribosomal protein S18 acetylase RimI-like enzyme